MRLLVCAQAVDKDDPTLGFFHQWLEELAGRFDRIIVVCLRTGPHTLPAHVEVIALGRGFRLQRALEVCSIAFARRKDYDAVFVHMSQEFILAAGWLWFLLRKRVFLWRNHYAGSILTDIAAMFSSKVFCTSKYSHTAKYRKTVVLPVGVDTDLFKPEPGIVRQNHSILFLGRLAPSKQPEIFLEALGELSKRTDFTATLSGPGEEEYVQKLQLRVGDIGIAEKVTFGRGMPHTDTPRMYSTHDIFVNLSPSGMLDKTMFEAAACGSLVLTASKDFAEIAGTSALNANVHDVADSLFRTMNLSENEKATQRARLQAVVQSHALAILCNRLYEEMRI